jgi:hypothetical protein
VLWLGFNDDDSTWEYRDRLLQDAPAAVRHYERLIS